LPALLSNGLLNHTELFDFEPGYYDLPSLLLTLAFSFHLRVESIEKISDLSPGEFGKLLGLDRIPEVKTIREKITVLSQNKQPAQWLSQLSRDWMAQTPNLSGVLYIDGHEEVYYGKNNPLPRRFISRLRLAMRATTDYWVCDKLGQPFFSVSKHVSGSMIETIQHEIVPRLIEDVPDQPSEETLAHDPFLHRFMIVYDRECYSPEFMLDMWDERIACCTYNKYVKTLWPEEEFRLYEVNDEYEERQTMYLAERLILIESKETEALDRPRQVCSFTPIDQSLSNDSSEEASDCNVKIIRKRTQAKRRLWAREVRKLSENGHQTSILTTNYTLSAALIGLYMFARWSQENFFKYMAKNFGIDALISYCKQTISDTTELVNPQWRDCDKRYKSLTGKLKRLEAKFGALTYESTDDLEDEQKVERYTKTKAQLQEDISLYRQQCAECKAERDAIPKRIPFGELAEEEKFDGVYTERKQFVDTIKMIVYRAETALSSLIKQYTSKPNESRALLAQLFQSSGNIEIDRDAEQLYISLHHQPSNRDDQALKELCRRLNETKIVYPGTNIEIVYKVLSE
jgi:hypothetical protein